MVEPYIGQEASDVAPVSPALKSGPRRRVVFWAVLAVVATYVAVVAGLDLTSSHHRPGTPPDWVSDLPGRLLLASPRGSLAIVRPDGQQLTAVTGLAPLSSGLVASSADDHLFAGEDGELLRVANGQVQRTASPIGADQQLPVQPFADHDNAFITVSYGPAGFATEIWAVSLHSGGRVSLGRGDSDPAADPASVGAFISVPALVSPVAYADTAIELRVAGRPPVVLATRIELYRDTHPTDTPVHLVAYPDPNGNKIAIVLDPLPGQGGDSNAPMVVLSRTGQFLDSVGVDLGPTEYVAPAWSPDGRSLAWTTFGPAGTELAIWSPHHRVRLLQPASLETADTASGCLWSYNGQAILCQVDGGVTSSNFWLLATRGGSVYDVAAVPDSAPIAWLASQDLSQATRRQLAPVKASSYRADR